jgi:phosphoribosyl 1,2-cyclic phosphodiesterase
MKHRHHNAETYALFLNDKVLYVSCAMFEDRMLSLYPKNVQVMIINTTLYNKRENIEHLSVEDAIKLIKGLNPQKAILTHFGYEFLKNHNPQEVADYITSLTGISTVSAFDNMEVYLH